MPTSGFEQFWYFLHCKEPTDTCALVSKLPPFPSAKLWMSGNMTDEPYFTHRVWALSLYDTAPSCKQASQLPWHIRSIFLGAWSWVRPKELLFQGKAPSVVIMQSWIHMLGLVLPNYIHWCWKTLRPRKRPKGLWALVAAKQAGFYTLATGETHKGQMVCRNIYSLRGMWKAWGRKCHLGSHEKHKGIKAWVLELLQGSGWPQVVASWSPLQPSWGQGPFL